ncbi:hypothetical protein FK535_00635 [Mycolicibacterium sp. 018/SC-01/001]|uniref:hypothetical protein n=1 Tax=Mycolicibacterium sp. 018/SC-01/001 TaxID=2592069 RepID=UPI00117EF93A|nr:hypothetical protein [Mycolicibacterium sp. 018/SC-01/001]TRW88827.1 hypothetical protein FK535_00635 [Mycolicibacterium sp. 018/SC-01/001]
MGRHSAAYLAAQQQVSKRTTEPSAVHVGRVGLLAFALGVGAAVVGGTAVAHADDSPGNDTGAAAATSVASKPNTRAVHAGPSVRASRRTEAARDPEHADEKATSDSDVTDGPTNRPRSLFRPAVAAGTDDDRPVLKLVNVVRQEFEAAADRRAERAATAAATTAAEPVTPAPTDQVSTPYGDIGKWMIEPSGQISDYGGQLEDGKTLLEPVNVVIVDTKSKNTFQARIRLNQAMRASGFPPQAIHSGGFRGIINGKTYRQQPSGLLQGYSDNFFLETNNHGRIFGPAPVATPGGYVWSGTFSEEEWGTYNGRPAHLYVSSNVAREALAAKMVASGRATSGGQIALDNAYNTDTVTTGDHDGAAAVLILT